MFGLDEWITGLGQAHPLLLATVIAALLGLRHATDPDHLSAVTTLVTADGDHRRAHAARLGLAWGGGHATTLVLFGLPIILASSYLPGWALQGAETLVGVVIIVLALRLLLRWRRGRLHVHAHRHGGVEHVHVHGHQLSAAHQHPHAAAASRSVLGSYGIGVVHGLGGSAGVGVLLLASIDDKPLAVGALFVFAAFTAASMAVCSGVLGTVLSSRRVRSRLDRLAPALGVGGAAFGVWYVAAAASLAPYPF